MRRWITGLLAFFMFVGLGATSATAGDTYGDKRAAWKYPARLVSRANLDLSGAETIDSVATAVGDFVLASGQTAAAENGIYVVAAGAWVRRDDFDRANKIPAGAIVFVTEGTADAGTLWRMTQTATITLGTTAITWAVNDLVSLVGGADFNAQTVLAATLDDTPAALTVAEQTVVGRITSGNVAALTSAQLAGILAEQGVPRMVKLNITTAELTAAATSQTFTIVTPSATRPALIMGTFGLLSTECSGGGATSCTFEIGQDESPDSDAYVAAVDIFTGAGAGLKGNLTAQKGAEFATGTAEGQVILSATKLVTVKVTSDVNVNTLTAADLTVYAQYAVAPL